MDEIESLTKDKDVEQMRREVENHEYSQLDDGGRVTTVLVVGW